MSQHTDNMSNALVLHPMMETLKIPLFGDNKQDKELTKHNKSFLKHDMED